MTVGLPFRLGSTSYVFDAGLADNAERLAAAGLVDDVELVLFETDDGQSNFPDAAAIDRLRAVTRQHGLSYTVHLPLDLRADDPAHPSLRQAVRVIALTAALSPLAYVAHLDGRGVDLLGWSAQAGAALDAVTSHIRPSALAVENLENYDPVVFAPLLTPRGVRRCVDVGHLWKSGRDPLPLLDVWLDAATVVHIHGCIDGHDHVSLAGMPPEQLDPVVARLLSFAGVVTLEVFGEDDFFSSRAALLASVERVTHGA